MLDHHSKGHVVVLGHHAADLLSNARMRGVGCVGTHHLHLVYSLLKKHLRSKPNALTACALVLEVGNDREGGLLWVCMLVHECAKARAKVFLEVMSDGADIVEVNI